MTTLVINTPDATRNNFKAVQQTLNRYGFELHRYHSQITDGGMTLVADVFRPQGEEESTARAALAAMIEGTTLYVLH
ncbi:hypothetical protein [Caballeronia sp. INML1]|uniref:hypothetical protein n=1 Tax=Caballeronia sp. INML1 TaxID=2921760 RepID=UPI002028873C|nr:hypothetical protein [Caballeronia sp. INML1]